MTRNGDWMQTFTGRQYWPIDPRPEDVFIEDIAHSLSLQCRFSGHVRVHYSVGDHSLRVSRLCLAPHRLWGLLHDAAEAYLVDLPRPIKRYSALGEEYKLIEELNMRAICERFGLSLPCPAEIKEIDDYVLQWEQRDLMALPPAQWKEHGAVLPDYQLIPIPPQRVEAHFLQVFRELTA